MKYTTRKLNDSKTSDHFQQLHEYVTQFYNHYSQQQLLHAMHEPTYLIEWKCYECKKSIEVDIRPFVKSSIRFNSSSLFCDKHKEDAQRSKNSLVFMRYESSFYSAIKKQIYQTIPEPN